MPAEEVKAIDTVVDSAQLDLFQKQWDEVVADPSPEVKEIVSRYTTEGSPTPVGGAGAEGGAAAGAGGVAAAGGGAEEDIADVGAGIGGVAGKTEASLHQLSSDEKLVAANMMQDFPNSVESGMSKVESSVGGHAKAAGSDLEGLSGQAKGAGSSITNFLGSGLGIGGMLGLGGAIVGTTAAALSYNKSLAQLQQAQSAAGESMPAAQLDAIETKMRSYGTTDNATAGALGTLAESHIPVSQQMGVMSAASDLAAAKGLSLQAALKVVETAAQGTGKGLKQYGIELPPAGATTAQLATDQTALSKTQQKLASDMATGGTSAKQLATDHLAVSAAQDKVQAATKSLKDPMSQLGVVTSTLEDRFKGQAKAAADQDPLKTLGATLDHVAVVAGEKLVPMLDRFSDWVDGHQAQISNVLTTVMTVAATAIGALGTALGPVVAILGVLGDHMTAVKVVAGLLLGAWVLIKTAGMVEYLGGMGASFLATAAEEGIATAAATLFGATSLLAGVTAAAAFLLPLVPFILLGAAIGLLVLLVVTHFSQIRSFIETVVGAIVGFFERIPAEVGSVVGRVVAFFGNIVSGVSSAIGQVLSFFSALPGRIVGALGNLGGMLLGAGASLIQGLINGIMGAVGAVVNAVKNAASSVVNAAKGVLGVLSPSTVFADIGTNVGLGLAQGIAGSQAAVTAAARGLATSTTVAVAPIASGAITAPLSGAAGNGGGTGATINIDMTGAVMMTDSDMDRFIDLLGGRLATFLAPAGGVAIRH